MQPLISPVDHESRNNSYRTEDQQTLTETTPLINNNEMIENFQQPLSATNKVIISFLFLTLVCGVIISVYLLAQQSDVFPSVDMPLQLILRSQWDPSNITEESPLLRFAPLSKAHHVIITPTNTDQCYGRERCRKLLIDMKKHYDNETAVLPYNFFISSNGLTFESLGWRKTSLLYPEFRNSSYVLGLIGNFTTSSPTVTQVQETLKLCSESVSQGYLKSSYDFIGKNGKERSRFLFQPFTSMPNWNKILSDETVY